MSSNEDIPKYVPIPYTFRLPDDTRNFPTGKGTAKCPPFYVQLDHTLAVIWSLFSEEQVAKPLGVAQIQWALSFLKRLKNRKGEHPADILTCIEAMEEALIKQYADMAETVISVMPSKTASEPIVETKSQDSTTFTPFSVNYAEMSKYKISPSERTLCTNNETPPDMNEKLKNLTSKPSQDIRSREEMVGFLKDFRKEQIAKVCNELKRLQSIEEYISSIDRCTFNPTMDNQDINIFKNFDCKE
ncbi:hypothetical protein FQA39_LY05971 [Lamprigera yunnana]|nr:hypothetical protein FQA39_LY05971 [Lamprigera yunnana]